MDASIPVARAVAIAGERVAGGVGTHETALASPDRVDLGGRCVLPGLQRRARALSDAGRSRSARCASRTRASLDETLERVAAAAESVEPGRWLRGRGWRSGDWSPAVEPDAAGARRGHRRHAGRAHGARLPLALAQLGGARAGGRRSPGRREASSRWTTTASRRASCARSRRGGSATATCSASDDEYVDAMRDGLRIAASRGVTAVHDKDGWLGALALLAAAGRRGRAHAARLAVAAVRPRRPSCEELGLPLRARRRPAAASAT